MGYALVISTCFVCKQPFSFNPHKVPSYSGEPICKSCIEIVNVKREEVGKPQFPVADDAYSYIDENEL